MADGRVEIDVDLNTNDANAHFDQMKEHVNGFGERAGSAFGAAKIALGNLMTQGIDMVVRGLGDMVSSTINVGMEFEKSMSKVQALSGASGDELQALSDKASELGATTTFSASEAADALGYMALAGWNTEEMLSGVDGVLTLAQASEMDLASASDLVTDYLSAFGMTAQDTGRMVDVMAYAQGNANTTTEGLGMAFKNCAANAHAAGLDVETTSAAISMLSNNGLKGAEAGTALNAIMRDMTAKMEDGAIAIGDTSVAVVDADGNYRDFVDIIADVESATNGMGDAEKAMALSTTFTADSVKGMNTLLAVGSEELSGFRTELYGADGAAQAMADTMTDNLSGDIAGLNSALEALQKQIFDSMQEPMRTVVQIITSNVVPALSSMFSWIQGNVIPVIASLGGWLADHLGPAASALGGLFTGTLIPALAAIWEVISNNVLPIFGSLAGFIADTLVPPIQVLCDVISTVVGFFGQMASAAGTAMSAAADAINSNNANNSAYGVSWNANGGIFNGPSIIGVGEAGPEAVIPLSGSSRMAPFAQEIAANLGGSDGSAAAIRELTRLLPQIISQNTPDKITVDSRSFGRIVRSY